MTEPKIAAEDLARRFHETYERLAPDFGYETRRASAKPWAEVPEQNRALMVAVCAELLTGPASPSEPVPDGPRVWAMPEIPADVKRLRDRDGHTWHRTPRHWRMVNPETGAVNAMPLNGVELLAYLGPLTEVVEEATP